MIKILMFSMLFTVCNNRSLENKMRTANNKMLKHVAASQDDDILERAFQKAPYSRAPDHKCCLFLLILPH